MARCRDGFWWIALGLMMTMIPAPISGQTSTVPIGGQFQVNEYTPGSQSSASVAMGPDGGFVVVWHSSGSTNGDDDYESIQARLYAADGSPIGSSFLVNSEPAGYQIRPVVATDDTGDFVVAWLDIETWPHRPRAEARRFASNGTPKGPEFLVSSTVTADTQDNYLALAVAPGGQFVVVWHRLDLPLTVMGRLFSSDGTPVGDDFEAPVDPTESQFFPGVAMDGAGNFVVVWGGTNAASGDPNVAVHGRRFASDGSPVGSPFLVNTYTTDKQNFPEVVMADDGRFVVVWDSIGSNGTDTSHHSIQARRFASDGSPIADEFQINSYTYGPQYFQSVAMDGSGDFVVAWASRVDPGDTSNFSVSGRRYTSDGNAVGDQFLINSYTTGIQIYPVTATSEAGDFVVAWRSSPGPADTSSYSIQAQLYRVTANLEGRVFFDADENGAQGDPADEPGVSGVQIQLLDADSAAILATTTSADDGSYGFQPKIAVDGQESRFKLHFEAPAELVWTQPDSVDDAMDSDVDPATGETPSITIPSAGQRAVRDAGLIFGPIFVDGFESGDTSAWQG